MSIDAAAEASEFSEKRVRFHGLRRCHFRNAVRASARGRGQTIPGARIEGAHEERTEIESLIPAAPWHDSQTEDEKPEPSRPKTRHLDGPVDEALVTELRNVLGYHNDMLHLGLQTQPSPAGTLKGRLADLTEKLAARGAARGKGR